MRVRFDWVVRFACVASLVGGFSVSARAQLDFALERLEVSGNQTFLDEFDDGLRNSPPTDQIVDQLDTVTNEAGGVLLFQDADGSIVSLAPEGTVFTDAPFLSSPAIVEGASGTTQIAARWVADLPVVDPSGNTSYRLVLTDPTDVDNEEVFASLLMNDFGSGPQPQLFVSATGPNAGFYGQDFPTLADLTNASTITFIFDVDHATNTLLPSYQFDDGPIIAGGSWQTPATPVPIYATVSSMSVVLAASALPEPASAASWAVAVLALTGLFRRRQCA